MSEEHGSSSAKAHALSLASFTGSTRTRINVLGDVFCDVVASGLGEELPSAWSTDTLAKVQILAGGSGLNMCCHGSSSSVYAERGVEFAMFGAIGNDTQGKLCRDTLSFSRAVDRCVVKDAATSRTGTCVVLSGASNRSFITDRGSVADFTVDYFDRQELLACTHLHIAGYYNCSSLCSQIPELLAEARSMGITTSLNPQFDASCVWGGIESVCRKGGLRFLIANEEEVQHIAKSHVQAAAAGGADEEEECIKAAARVILQWGCDTIIVTRGGKGAMAIQLRKQEESEKAVAVSATGEEEEEVAAAAAAVEARRDDKDLYIISQASVVVEVVDTCGAGDAFTASFLGSLVLDHDLTKALRSGCIGGAAACGVVGGSAVPSEEMRRNIEMKMH